MFNATILESPFISDIANETLGRITTSSANVGQAMDYTFISTLRALLGSRTADGESVRLFCCMPGVFSNTNPVLYLARADLIVCTFNHPNNFDEGVEKFEHDEASVGFRKVRDLSAFVSRKFKAEFFINDELKKTVVFYDNNLLRNFHFLQSMTPRLLPWFFKDKPIDDEEKALLLACTSRYETAYKEAIAKLAARYDFERIQMQRMISGFYRRARERQLNDITTAITSVRERMSEYMRRYRESMQNLDELNIRLLGFQSDLENEDGKDAELLDYISSHRNIVIEGAEGFEIRFFVRTYMDMFDVEMYETIRNKNGSHLYAGHQSEFWTVCRIRQLLDAIFSDEPLLRVKMLGYYKLDTRGAVDSVRGFIQPDSCHGYMPNPHLYYYDCLGMHAMEIDSRMRDGDIIGAMEQCVASAKSINVGEGPTCSRFVHDLLVSTTPYIELPDKRVVTAVAAIKWLDAREEGNHEAN